MKTCLRFLPATLCVIGVLVNPFKANSQCKASEILIQNVVQATTQTPGTCAVTFDLSFQMENNNGNKFIFLHAWLQSQYPDFFDCVDGHPSGNGAIQPPVGTDLVGSFL